MKRAKKKVGRPRYLQRECACCGVFTEGVYCQQCQFAGCGLKKIGEKCRVQTMASAFAAGPASARQARTE